MKDQKVAKGRNWWKRTQIRPGTTKGWDHYQNCIKIEPPRVPKGPKVKGENEGTLKKECPSSRGDYNEGIYPELLLKENEVGTVVPQNERQVPEIDKKNDKNDERWDFESPRNLADKKTARWIKEQNEFLGKQKEREFWGNRKVRDQSVFEPSGPIKVLQKQRANLRTKYEQIPQYLMDDQKGQTPHPPLVVTNKGDVNWRGQGKRYPLKEKRRTQWGGYGKQYGTGGDRNQVTRLMELMEPKPKVVILLMHCKGRAIISQLEVLGMDKVEMGEMRIEMIERNTGY